MRRALSEYVIAGIKTTIPFFSWLLAQPEFLAGEFHTSYLDEVLSGRNGRPFVEAEEVAETVAAMAVALRAVMSPEATAAGRDGTSEDGERRWRTLARAEGLR
jgi:acetyl-CoA carboxylase biotin carboxylase subunit